MFTVNCNKDLSGKSNGIISSPSWPNSYAENANCQYTLLVDSQSQVALEFSDVFDVEQGPNGQCIDALRVSDDSEYANTSRSCVCVPPRNFNFAYQ